MARHWIASRPTPGQPRATTRRRCGCDRARWAWPRTRGRPASKVGETASARIVRSSRPGFAPSQVRPPSRLIRMPSSSVPTSSVRLAASFRSELHRAGGQREHAAIAQQVRPSLAALAPAVQPIARPDEQGAVLGVARRRRHHLDPGQGARLAERSPAQPAIGRAEDADRASRRRRADAPSAGGRGGQPRDRAPLEAHRPQPLPSSLRTEPSTPCPLPLTAGPTGFLWWISTSLVRATPAALTAVSSAVVTTGSGSRMPAFQVLTHSPPTTSNAQPGPRRAPRRRSRSAPGRRSAPAPASARRGRVPGSSRPIASSPSSASASTAGTQASSAAPPPGTTPSSTAARAEATAASTRQLQLVAVAGGGRADLDRARRARPASRSAP